MAKTVIYDPGTSEARSSWLVGLTEACNKITGVLDMQVGTLTDVEMPELYIADNDRYRIYQVGENKKLWLTEPKPVIKKNGVEITESTDGFTIDYLGGSIAFESNKRLTASDTVTVSATYIIDKSKTVAGILSNISDLTGSVERYKGAYTSIADLRNAFPTGTAGEFAVVINEKTFYFWNSTDNDWDIIQAELNPKGTNEDSDWYYYGGRNTWQDLKARVLGSVLTGLDTTTAEKIEAADTIVKAFGKLQAQINDGVLGTTGEGAPTVQTIGKIGQDYIDTTTGKKYHMTAIDVSTGAQQYIWEEYANVSDLPQFDSTPTADSTNGVTSGGVYTALQTTQDEADGKFMKAQNPTGTGSFSLSRKSDTTVGGHSSTLGHLNTASALCSHAEGRGTIAAGIYSHAQGKYNIEDTQNKYAHIVGNGTSASARSNAYTLDWQGYGWFAGGVTVGTDDKILANINQGNPIVSATSTDGQTYTVMITDYNYNPEDGSLLTIIPNRTSLANTCILNLNGEQYVLVPFALNEDGVLDFSNNIPDDWLQADVPITVQYRSSDTAWVTINPVACVADGLLGKLGISQGGTGATTATEALSNLGGQTKHKTKTATLTSGLTSWTVTVSGVTASNTVVVSPASSSVEAYSKAGVVCTAQASNSLTFTATTAPEANLTVNVLILD